MFVFSAKKIKGASFVVDLTDGVEEYVSAAFADKVLSSSIGAVLSTYAPATVDFYSFCVEQQNLKAVLLGRSTLQAEIVKLFGTSVERVDISKECKLSDFNFVSDDVLYVPYGTEVICSRLLSCINKYPNTIVFPATLRMLSKTTYDCKRIVFQNTIVPKNDLCFDNSVFMGTNVSQIILPNTLKVLPSRAFIYANVKEVVLPKTLIRIGESAFLRCWELEHIELPKSLTAIERSAFCESGLSSIVIPNGVRLEAYVFSRCMSLTEVHLPVDLEMLAKGLFSECFTLEHIFIPDKVVDFEEDVFYACRNLKSVSITASLLKKQIDLADKNMFSYTSVSNIDLRFVKPLEFEDIDIENIHNMFPLLQKVTVQSRDKDRVVGFARYFQVEVV